MSDNKDGVVALAIVFIVCFTVIAITSLTCSYGKSITFKEVELAKAYNSVDRDSYWKGKFEGYSMERPEYTPREEDHGKLYFEDGEISKFTKDNSVSEVGDAYYKEK